MASKLKKFWHRLGSGFITGASDDDPSGIATYTIAGAQHGMTHLWVMVYILPLMIAIQDMSARIGAMSGCGLAGNIKRHYPKWLLATSAGFIISANLLNIGANISGMAGAVNLLLPIGIKPLALIVSAVVILLTVKLHYRQISTVFKWTALLLLSYVVAAFFVSVDFSDIIRSALIPHLTFSKNFLIVFFALFGTTVAPYLHFWQANEEAEVTHETTGRNIRVCKFHTVSSRRIKRIDADTRFGMMFSNVVAFFIIIVASSTLFRANIGAVETLEQAAHALYPLAGPYAALLFTIGLLGAGFLSIPVLAGSAAYVLAEAFGWQASMDQPFHKALPFHIVIIAAIIMGVFIAFSGLSPVKALFYSALVNAIVSPLLIGIIIHMANNPAITGPYRVKHITNVFAYITLIIMSGGAVLIFVL